MAQATLNQFQVLWDTLEIKPDKVVEINNVVARITNNKERYKKVQDATGVPWRVIAVIHYRESSLNFNTHLHNGDPLKARTTHVPAGRPKTGNPPFTWEESAIDALKGQGLNLIKDWHITNTLTLLEKYNGLGYAKKNKPSPYIWSFTNHYKSGKYVADGKYDEGAMDKQAGVAVLLKFLKF